MDAPNKEQQQPTVASKSQASVWKALQAPFSGLKKRNQRAAEKKHQQHIASQVVEMRDMSYAHRRGASDSSVSSMGDSQDGL
jgi:hypothetical protein